MLPEPVRAVKSAGRWRRPEGAARSQIMRAWYFHPLVFYPLATVIAVLVILVSLRPQTLPRPEGPVTAAHARGALVYERDGFNSPSAGANQAMTVTRNFWGQPQTLRIAVQPSIAAPTPAEHGVRILMAPGDAAAINNRPVTVDVSYAPLPINAASALAVSLQGGGPAAWVSQPTPPQTGTIRFELPAHSSVNAIGLRAISTSGGEAYGLEITRIRVSPHA